jgi:uroporphyrinogen-III synthase
MRSLSGRTIALLESRLSEDFAAMVRRLGGTPISAPSVREVARADDFDVFIDGLSQGRFALAVFLTGAGANALFREADRRGRLAEALDALGRITIACRGPKPLAALKRQGLAAQITTAKPHTTHELLEVLGATDLTGRAVVLVHYGERNAAMADALRARGARLDEVCPYVWALPENVEPIRKVVDEALAQRIDAMLFTSQIQCRNLFQVAGDMNRADDLTRALNADIVVGAIGPVCADALRQLGITPDVMPAASNMASLITAIADYFDLTGKSEV